MQIFINLSKVWKFAKKISIKKKKVKILTSFLFINFVIFSDLLIISILNYLITGEITSNQYISFLFNSFAAFYLVSFIVLISLFFSSSRLIDFKISSIASAPIPAVKDSSPYSS